MWRNQTDMGLDHIWLKWKIILTFPNPIHKHFRNFHHIWTNKMYALAEEK